MSFEVVIRPSAERDLRQIARWIAERADTDVAIAYVARIRQRIARLEIYPDRFPRRSEFGTDIRGMAFERRLLVLYRVSGDAVIVTRVIGGAQDLSDLAL